MDTSTSNSIIPVDYECTSWPDVWFGISITDCCITHDLGGSNWELAMCVADKHWAFLPLGIIMFLGIIFLKPLYKALLRRRKNGNDIDKT